MAVSLSGLQRAQTKKTIADLYKAASYAKKMNLEVHAGHGLTYESVKPI